MDDAACAVCYGGAVYFLPGVKPVSGILICLLPGHSVYLFGLYHSLVVSYSNLLSTKPTAGMAPVSGKNLQSNVYLYYAFSNLMSGREMAGNGRYAVWLSYSDFCIDMRQLLFYQETG